MIFIDAQNAKVPSLGYGTWKLAGAEAEKSVLKALEIGYRHIDTAQIYGNEKEVGDAINASGIQRNDIFLTTKVWIEKLRNGDLQKSVDESLKKLSVDFVDLLLIHWPVSKIPFAEQLKALQEVKAAGKTKMIGVSNFTVAHMQEVVETIGAPVVTNQVEYHPCLSQKPVLDYLRAHKMFLTAYSPLGRGSILDNDVLKTIAAKHGKSAGQVTLRWLVQQPGVAAIPKAASEKNMRDNFNIFDFSLTDDEMKQIHGLARPDGRLVNPDFAPEWDKAA